MMTVEQLKDAVLLFAMQGKLNTRCSSDLPIEGTLKKIYSGKGRINPIDSEQIPYELPEGWEWARLEDITDNCDNPFADGPFGSNLKREHYTEKHEVRIIQLSNIGESGWRDANEKYTTYEHLKTIERSKVNAGDIVIAKMMPAGRAIEVPVNDYAYVLSSDAVKFVAHPLLNKRFLLMAINSPVFREQVYSEVHGVTRVRTSLKKLKSYIVPLPPLAEQKRIVAKIEELMPFVEQYAAASTKLNTLNTTFPDQMKKSIFQEAVQGKLVPQDPNDEPASVLLKKIAEEKKRLIKEGKIKKQKPLPDITEDEISFDIPESWEWVRIGEIFRVGTGMTPLKGNSLFYDGGSIPWITSSLTSERYITQADSFVTQYAVENTTLTVYPAHSLIIAMYGQGKTRGQVSELLINATTNQACAVLEYYIYYPELIEYTYYYFMFNYDVLRKKAEGTSQPNLNLKKIVETIIPIPPLNEQRRIIVKTKEIINGIDTLSSKL